MTDYLSWWSIASSLLNVILLAFAIWQLAEGKKQKEKANAQIKIWMQDANGISNALMRIFQDIKEDKYSSPKDICNAIWAVQSSAFAIYQSLYEERCITEKEYKERQKRLSDALEKAQNEQKILNKNILEK